MSFSDPVKIIDHIPQDFDMKIKHSATLRAAVSNLEGSRLHRCARHRFLSIDYRSLGMTTIKEIAKMLHALGRKASMDGAREYVLSHYDSAMPAYWQDPRASLNVLDALMETRIADSYESSLKATLRISTELDAAIEHASWLIYNEVLELEYDEHPKPAHEDNIAPEEIPY